MTNRWMWAISTMSCLALGTLAVGCGTEGTGDETVVSALTGATDMAYQRFDHFLGVARGQNFQNNSSIAMANGTVPSQVNIPTSGIEIGIQRSDGHWVVDHFVNGGHSPFPTDGLIRGGTSPALALCPTCGSGYAFAFQGTDGRLWSGEGGTPTGGTPMKAFLAGGTNPSLAMKTNLDRVYAYQGTNGHMFVSTANPPVFEDSNGLLAGGTSPGIAVGGPNNNVGIAFQGANGHLWFGFSTFQCHDKFQNVRGGTSPTVAISPGGNHFFVAYQNSNGFLHVFRTDNGVENDFQINVNMSNNGTPQIIPKGNAGYQIWAKGSNTTLRVVLNTSGVSGQDQIEDENLAMN
jgi:hypothetical protein